MITLPKSLRIATAAAAVAILAGASAASAGTPAQPQPSGAEVSHRLAKHGHRIGHALGKGKITRTEANLRKHAGTVGKKGRLMASKHGVPMKKTEGRSSNRGASS